MLFFFVTLAALVSFLPPGADGFGRRLSSTTVACVNIGTLAEDACCDAASGVCETDSCSHECAAVFTPFYEACFADLDESDVDADLHQLYFSCRHVENKAGTTIVMNSARISDSLERSVGSDSGSYGGSTFGSSLGEGSRIGGSEPGVTAVVVDTTTVESTSTSFRLTSVSTSVSTSTTTSEFIPMLSSFSSLTQATSSSSTSSSIQSDPFCSDLETLVQNHCCESEDHCILETCPLTCAVHYISFYEHCINSGNTLEQDTTNADLEHFFETCLDAEGEIDDTNESAVESNIENDSSTSVTTTSGLESSIQSSSSTFLLESEITSLDEMSDFADNQDSLVTTHTVPETTSTVENIELPGSFDGSLAGRESTMGSNSGSGSFTAQLDDAESTFYTSLLPSSSSTTNSLGVMSTMSTELTSPSSDQNTDSVGGTTVESSSTQSPVCDYGYKGEDCSTEFASLALVVSLPYPEDLASFKETFESEIEIALELPDNSVTVLNVYIFSPDSFNRRLEEAMVLVEIEIVVSGDFSSANSIVQELVTQLDDPYSLLMTGSIGSAIDTNYGLLHVDDEGGVSLYFDTSEAASTSILQTFYSSWSILSTTGSISRSSTSLSTSSSTSSSTSLSSSTSPVIMTTKSTDTAGSVFDDFVDMGVPVHSESNSTGVVVLVIVLAVVVVVLLTIGILVFVIRRRAQIGTKLSYTITNDELSKQQNKPAGSNYDDLAAQP